LGKIRRGNYIFVSWVSDHQPRHVHVYRDRRLIVKWDLDRNAPIKGAADRQILAYIEGLRREGRL